MSYLHEESYYSEAYDQATIEQCRWWVAQKFEEKFAKKLLSRKGNTTKYIIDILYIRKGERFRHKAETIREWMDRDRAKDERLSSAVQPSDAHCRHCGLTMECIDRSFHARRGNKDEDVLFVFTCSNCKRGRIIWEGGEEWEMPPTPCTKCQTHLESTDKRVGNIITTTYTCPNCNHKETSKLDLDEKYIPPPADPHFEEDRKKYCMSNEEGYDYVRRMDSIKELMDGLKFKEENKKLFELKAKIKTLPVAELQNLLNPSIQKAGYTNFVLGKPEFLRGVTVEFATQDTQIGRAEYDSRQALKKLLEHVLEETNWRLMSDGISYRLGFLTGRLRGVEGDEELLELAKKALKNETR